MNYTILHKTQQIFCDKYQIKMELLKLDSLKTSHVTFKTINSSEKNKKQNRGS
jgi:hypothetical protein